ncbi:hypothetical protein CK503_10465 [Aliifodinibius salipaludis]|uniref:Uncharacterized protein n=1 Tax=Fodinibius salipaludis TaxID=2032627 RepID=A0A2A2G7G6_9BACT|nr:hypothetical protein [Aliifodinibius salipaludis]PAU93571.1 hypothetical protein CK503_10465 [Aliifodinibius salipaludis]
MSTFSTILSFLIVITACAPSKDDVSSKTDEKNADSLITQSHDDTMRIQPPAPPLSPGTAKIKANLEKIEKDGDEATIYISVVQILQRGPSTPSLPKGKTVKVNATTFKKNAEQQFLTLEEGKQFILFVGYTQSLGKQSQNWTLNKINTDSTTKNVSDDS